MTVTFLDMTQADMPAATANITEIDRLEGRARLARHFLALLKLWSGAFAAVAVISLLALALSA